MKELDYKQLTDAIKNVFVNPENFQLDKHVPEFKKDGKYVGDFFNFTMFELDGENPPIFYHTYSPYDIISSKTTDYAAIFRDGERIADFNFQPFMMQRTAAMTSLVVSHMQDFSDISSKKVLYIGTGKIATRDLESLKEHFSTLRAVDFINSGNNSSEFIDFAKALGVKAQAVTIEALPDYDLIICHTSSKSPVLTANTIPKIKHGAVITTFSSEDFQELDESFYNDEAANIIVDWEQTKQEAVELKSAIEQGLAVSEKIMFLKDFLSGDTGLDNTKKYTIYRSHGTPMQDLAALKLIREQKGL